MGFEIENKHMIKLNTGVWAQDRRRELRKDGVDGNSFISFFLPRTIYSGFRIQVLPLSELVR